MNLQKLRQMASDGDMSALALRYLLECKGECEYLDYKEYLYFETDYNRASFARDVLAMKNVGGGYIIVGVKDKTWEPLGLRQTIKEDTKLLREIVRKVTGLELAVDIVRHIIPTTNGNKEFAIILVRASAKRNKRRIPSACKFNFMQKEDWGLRDGEIYFRKGDQSVRIHADELESLLLDLDELEDKVALEQQRAEPSPFYIENGLYRILPPEYETFITRSGLQETVKNLVIDKDLRIWIVNVYGPGGVGKSALVSWIAQYCYDNHLFDAILHLSAKGNQLTETGIRMLRPTLNSLENLIDNILYLFGFSQFVDESLEERKHLAQTLLSDYSTLLILDNMETMVDGRVIQFVSSLPPSNKSRVLLTSRSRTSEWEKPLRVDELELDETKNFLRVKADEKNISITKDFDAVTQKVHISSGGLPLAIVWILGQFAITGDWDTILNKVPSPDSPLLEFSFNFSWQILTTQAQKALAVFSVFDEPPTLHLWSMVLDWSTETVERAAAKLIEATFVSERTDEKTGEKTYHTLPITKAFAQNKLSQMGEVEIEAKRAYMRYRQQMELVDAEIQSLNPLFDSFNVERDTEKQAIIIARKAQSYASSFNYDDAEKLYEQALGIDPRSVYVLINYGMFKCSLDQIGEAIKLLETATGYANKKTGFLVYYNLSQVYDKIKYRKEVEKHLLKALEYNSQHPVARHQLGVVKGRLGKHEEALNIFDNLIEDELHRESGPTDTLLFAFKTKIITLKFMKKNELAKSVREEALKELENWPHLSSKSYQLG